MVSITEESTVGRRIVTAAEYDRWKAVNDEIHVDVKCSAEEVIVTLEGALPHTPFHLKDPGCRLEPISRNAQQIQIRPPTACGSSLTINSTHLVLMNEIVQSIATSLAPEVFSGRIGCIFSEDELRTSLYYDSPSIPMLNDAMEGRTWEPIETYGGIGKDLIWARMDIFKDKPFGQRFDSLPKLDSNEKLHIGLELMRAPTEEAYLFVDKCWAVPNDYSDLRLDLVSGGCMDDSLRKEGIEFSVVNNGESNKVHFSIPVFKFVGSEHVYLQCQVKACLRRSCLPSCGREDVVNEYEEFLYEQLNASEVVYDDEWEEMMLEDGPQLKAANSAQRKSNLPQFSQLSSVHILINEVEETPEIIIDRLGAMILTVLVVLVIFFIVIVCLLFQRRRRQTKQFSIST